MQGLLTQTDAMGIGVLRQGADEAGGEEHAPLQALRDQRMSTKRDLNVLCEEWAAWHRTRRIFVPPLPVGLLGSIQPRKVGPEPDAICSSALSFFNLAVLSLPESPEKQALYLFYIHRVSHIKRVASALGISRDAFYKRVESGRAQAYRAYCRMVECV